MEAAPVDPLHFEGPSAITGGEPRPAAEP
jgi:hypothetical protein